MIEALEKSKPHPHAVKNVRESRRLDRQDVERDAGISVAQLSAIENGEESASRAVLKKLAKHYAVPVYFFYVDNLDIAKTTLPDFRSPHTKIAKLSGSLAASIVRANEIRDIISEGWEYISGPTRGQERLPALTVELSVSNAALKLRKYFQLISKTPDSFETSKAYLDWLRARAESSGLITIFETLEENDGRGYCIAHDNKIPFIVINTLNNHGLESRIFTLMHEVVHVALRKSGISDPFATRNAIERFCNRVAAETLMPGEEFLVAAKRLSSIKSINQFVRSIAEAFKVSQQAAALRSEEVGAKPAGFYRRWLSQFTEDYYSQVSFEQEDQIRISRDIGKKKIAKYGTSLPKILFELFEYRFISALDIRRISGIKPKYLSLTYEAAVRRLQELGLNGE
jgi:Zn-dependent peptidase ImmA (M78 family)